MSLLLVLIGLCLVMAGAWVWQKRAHNIGWVDVFWTLGTALAGVALALAWADAHELSARRLTVCVLIGAWAVRLGVYVAVRVAGSSEDGRYIELRQAWGDRLQPRLFGFLQLQALVGLALAASVALAADRPTPDFGLQDLFGAAIAIIAIAGEALADRQLKTFTAVPDNRGKVCDVGLWAWSRHPNYFFEWLGWFAYPAIALDLSGAYARGAWSLIAPALMFAVLRFGTGAPPLEAHMLRTRGDVFRAYQARVPIFLPRPPRA